ncbi:unnamed protein product [Mycena citricolor]|uniref:Importin N-terminal domain-containing protein n=1 Tax=Mycena citricolor TaxID=2018698 RepID=A0AAD2H3Z2_9AGAR|nr:unnamed protein product [Mycena citricolor]
MSNFVQGLHDLLQQATAGDTNLLKSATAQLNLEYYKNPACIPALASIMSSAATQPVRQLAAVEMRKRVSQNSSALWTQLGQSDRSHLVRHSVARVIAAIANIEIPLGTWPELLGFLTHLCLPASAATGIGIFMLYTFFTLFSQLLADPESIEVRITTVRALGVIASYIDVEDKAEVSVLHPQILALPTDGYYSSKKSKIQSNNLAGAILQGLMPSPRRPSPKTSTTMLLLGLPLRIIDGLALASPLRKFSLPPKPYHRILLLSRSNNRRGCHARSRNCV